MSATIYTHSEAFHADELLAIALLQETVLKGVPVTIVRTRDPKELARVKADPTVFVVDVGFEYDPARRNFDHHQQTLTRAWPDGTPFSACGLVWTWLRERGELASWGEADVLDALEERIVRPADQHDNGIAPWPEGVMLMGYNRSTKDAALARRQFDRALGVAKDFLANVRIETQKDMEACRRMRRALHEPIHAEGLVVIEDMRSSRFPYWAARLTEQMRRHGRPVTANLVITHRQPGQWNVVSLPATLTDPFSCKCPTPIAWRGQTNVPVALPTGPAELLFCHKSGHLTVVKGSLDQAIAVAQQIQAGPTP